MDVDLTFGQWLKQRRRGLGLTQRTLGQQAGYAGETVRKVEADELRPSRQMAERLAEVLQVPPAEREAFIRFARAEPDAIAFALPAATAQFAASPVSARNGESPDPDPGPRRHNLPAALTTFIGRQPEIAAVRQLLAERRLVTVTGPGGMGKSRLSVEVARGLHSAIPRGAWLVELAALSDPRLVPRAVANVFGLHDTPGQPPLAALLNYLRDKALLLVLDNCEHLIDACAELAQTLLHHCPALRLLATSREALGIAGEVTYTLPPLSLPSTDNALPPRQLLEYESIRLFVDRAATALPGFAVTGENAPAVAEVCQRLEGMPLALELAAARVKVLRVSQIAARLDDRFRLLAGGSRTGLPRHQTLKATIDWSYELLAEAERAVLRRASVFAGGWTLAAAEAVCAGEGVEAPAVLDLLASLANKSMIAVGREPGREPRYRMLETVRQYSQDRLRAAGESDLVRDRHLAYFVGFAEEAEPHIYQADQVLWLERLRADHDNLRLALAWSLDRGQHALSGARLAAALWRFWDLHGHLVEGLQWLERALAAETWPATDWPAEVAGLRGRLCARAAYVFMMAGDLPRAVALSDEGLALCRAFGTRADAAQALILKAWTTWDQDDLEGATVLFHEGIGLARAAQHRSFEAVAHFELGGIEFSQSHYELAEQHWLACLAICREVGDNLGVADTFGRLAKLAQVRGRFDEAQILLDEQLAQFRALAVRTDIGSALIRRGALAATVGDYGVANRHLDEALALLREAGRLPNVGVALLWLGKVARREGNYQRAEAWLNDCLALGDGRDGEWFLRRAAAWLALGAVARCQRDYQRALALLRDSLRAYQQIGWDQVSLIEVLREMALLFAGWQQPGKAARLLAAAEALRTTIGAALSPVDQADTEHVRTAVRDALGEPAFAAAWAEGAAQPLEQAIAYALAD